MLPAARATAVLPPTLSTPQNDRILVPDAGVGAFNFASGQSVTMEAVIRTINSGQGGSGNIISKQGAVAGSPIPGEWYFRVLNGKLRFSANDGTGLRTANGAIFVNDGQWHHVAAVYDASAGQMRVYQDYILQGTATTTFSGVIGNTNDLWLGQQNNGGAKFDGDIDFIRFSYGALDPTNFVKAITSIDVCGEWRDFFLGHKYCPLCGGNFRWGLRPPTFFVMGEWKQCHQPVGSCWNHQQLDRDAAAAGRECLIRH